MRMIFVFIDGLGIGEDDPSKNPITAENAPHLHTIFRNFRLYPTDACLGVPGLPQSATGQTTIFTGVNAPAVLGRHLNAQPTVTLKNIICQNNLFKELTAIGLRITNANCYRQEYLDKMLDPTERRYRPSTTSVMTMSAGIPFRRVEDFKRGHAVYHDITGKIIKESGYDVEVITAAQAAGRLFAISRENDFTLYEHFLSDIAGHSQDMKMAVEEVKLLDEFLGELFRIVDLTEDIIILTSDHGNLEDMSVKTHTLNKVPTIIAGPLPEGFERRIESLLDIMPAVVEIFKRTTL